RSAHSPVDGIPSKSEAPLGKQPNSLPDGPRNAHLARAALQVVSEDQRRFSKNYIQFAKLQQDVHHALKSVRLHELAAVSRYRRCQNGATVGAEAAREILHTARRKQNPEQPGSAVADQASRERNSVYARSRPI